MSSNQVVTSLNLNLYSPVQRTKLIYSYGSKTDDTCFPMSSEFSRKVKQSINIPYSKQNKFEQNNVTCNLNVT